MNRRIPAVLALAGAALALPAAAGAHVTVHPNEIPAGGFTVVDVRVPNEEAKAVTTKVDVKLPDGILFVSTAPKAGWTAKVSYAKLDKPVKEFGETITQQASRVTFTAKSKADGLQPGEFDEFPLSISVPKGKGPLTFPALQTYTGGEVVRWIGKPDSEHPAPQVALVGANDPIADVPAGVSGAMAMGGASKPATPTASTTSPKVIEKRTGASKGLAIAALIVGALGLVAGGAALATRRRPA